MAGNINLVERAYAIPEDLRAEICHYCGCAIGGSDYKLFNGPAMGALDDHRLSGFGFAEHKTCSTPYWVSRLPEVAGELKWWREDVRKFRDAHPLVDDDQFAHNLQQSVRVLRRPIGVMARALRGIYFRFVF